MADEPKYGTPQEQFWAGKFGADYIGRNQSPELLASNLNFFARALGSAATLRSCVEFGANIGMNLRALGLLYPGIRLTGVEINPTAAKELTALLGEQRVFEGSIFDYPIAGACDLALIKGVLIHINPEKLGDVYRKLYQASNRYILLCEYYNSSPVAIPYRGHEDRLFKRDFAGEMLDAYPDLTLLDYGFVYRRDPSFPQDDVTWFLMEKKV